MAVHANGMTGFERKRQALAKVDAWFLLALSEQKDFGKTVAAAVAKGRPLYGIPAAELLGERFGHDLVFFHLDAYVVLQVAITVV